MSLKFHNIHFVESQLLSNFTRHFVFCQVTQVYCIFIPILKFDWFIVITNFFLRDYNFLQSVLRINCTKIEQSQQRNISDVLVWVSCDGEYNLDDYLFTITMTKLHISNVCKAFEAFYPALVEDNFQCKFSKFHLLKYLSLFPAILFVLKSLIVFRYN